MCRVHAAAVQVQAMCPCMTGMRMIACLRGVTAPARLLYASVEESLHQAAW